MSGKYVFIGSSLSGSNPVTVSSIGDLKNISAVDGGVIITSGYYLPGDGGGGEYYFDAADTTSADNGGTIIVGANGARWKLVVIFEVSIKQFGAKLDSITDDTAAIQACWTWAGANNADVYHPKGTAKTTATLTISSNNTGIRGATLGGAAIVCSTNNTTAILVTGTQVTITNLYVGYSVTPISGAIAIKVIAQNATLDNIIVNHTYVGLQFGAGGALSGTTNTAGGCRIRNFQVIDHVSIGIFLWGTVDCFFEQGLINAANVTNAALGNIRLLDGNEAFLFDSIDILLGVYSFTSDATVYGIATRAAYGRFTNVYFDSSAQDAQITKMVETNFTNVWFSCGRSAGGFPGATIDTCDSLTFMGGQAFNCGADGILVNASAVRIFFIGMNFESNSVTSGSGIKHGLEFAIGCTDFSVLGGCARNGLYSVSNQAYGIAVGSGCSNYSIVNVDCLSNVSGAIFDGSNAATGFISQCKGYITQAKGTNNVAIGASTRVVTHGLSGTPVDADITINLTASMAVSGVNSIWLSAIGATTFQVNTNVNVATAALTFGWEARISGA